MLIKLRINNGPRHRILNDIIVIRYFRLRDGVPKNVILVFSVKSQLYIVGSTVLGDAYWAIMSNALRSRVSWEKKQAARTLRIALTCSNFRRSRLPVSCMISLTRSISSLSRVRSYSQCQTSAKKKQEIATDLKFHPSFLVAKHPPTRARRPRFQMQPLQERRAPPRFPLQTPIPAQHKHKRFLLPHHHLTDVFHDPFHDDAGDERRAWLVSFSIGTRRLGEF